MARKNQRTKEQKEIILNQLMGLMKQGCSKREAARRLGMDEKQVRRDWEELACRLNTENRKNLALLLAEYREVKRVAWDSWEQSKKEWERTVVETAKSPAGAPDGRVKVIKTKENKLPNCAYLETIRKVLNRECELLGLNPPKNMRLTVEELDQVIEAELARLASDRANGTAGSAGGVAGDAGCDTSSKPETIIGSVGFCGA